MKKQDLKTIDISIVLILLALSMTLSWKLVSAGEGNPDIRKAQNDTKGLSLQLLSGGLGTLHEEEVRQTRGPASATSEIAFKRSLDLFGKTGKLGLDPWGQPYRYSFVEEATESGQNATVVLVWSDGPNGKSETDYDSMEQIKITKYSNLSKIFQGDDVGFLRGSK